jgi:hypothetical protein
VRTIQRGSICIAVLLAHAEARADDCTPPTPGCHLENGKRLIKTDPKRAATELLASYKLDERTDTLVLYANALELDHRYALAAETWQRVITYRESELTAAKEGPTRAAVNRAKKLAEAAAEGYAKLAPKIARVRIRFAAGPKPAVSRDGAEVDASHEVIVVAGHDELVFTRADGAVERLAVNVAAGENVRIDAPAWGSKPVPAAQPKPEAQPKLEATKPAEVEVRAKPKMKPEPTPAPVVVTSPDPTLARDTPAPSRTLERVGMGFGAGAIVLGGIAGTYGYLASHDFDRAQAAGCSSNGECTPGRAANLAQQSNDRARVAQITAIGAGALLATGVTLYVFGRSKRHAATDVSLRVAPSSATVAWRF